MPRNTYQYSRTVQCQVKVVKHMVMAETWAIEKSCQYQFPKQVRFAAIIQVGANQQQWGDSGDTIGIQYGFYPGYNRDTMRQKRD